MSTISEESYQFKNLILSDKYLDEQSKLTAIIGVNDKEEPILFDFSKQPHLFIGGDQGCGKSTLIHSIIMSLMQRNTPEEFQFVYLDPKGLDFNLYNKSKYLHISKNHNIVDIFEYLTHECDRRLRMLSDNKKKTIASFNDSAAVCGDVQAIPELFIILDEVSSFIDDAKRYIEQLISYGRTVSIHLVIADTNPTLVSILKIARIIPDKVVFRFTYADYKALLDRNNIVPLSGDGEILCDFRGTEYVHGHSCFVSEDEIKDEVAKNIVEFKEEKQVKKKEVTVKVKEECDSESVEEIRAESVQISEPQEESEPEESRFQRFLKNFVSRHLVASILVSMSTIFAVMYLIFRQETKVQFLILSAAVISVLLSFAIRDMLKWKNRDPNIPDSGEKNKNVRYVYIVVTVLIAIIALFFFLNLEKEVLKIAGSIVAILALFIAAVYFLISVSESKSKSRVSYNIYAIDNLSDGHDFEYVVADLLKSVGFYNVRVTVGSGDYGIDVVGWYGESSYAIQCKKYSGKVGVSAVQEAFAGRSYYGCNYAMVITNNYFTPAAIKLAESTGVILWDRNNVKKLINGHI